MARIKIDGLEMQARVAHSGDTLALTFDGARIEDIAQLLNEDDAPEIRVMNADGTTRAIFVNHALSRVSAETIGGCAKVTAVMQTSRIEQTEAQEMREAIALLEEENELLTECVLELSAILYA